MDFAEPKPLKIKCQLQNSCFTSVKLANFIPRLNTTNMAKKQTKELDDSSSLKCKLNLVFSSPYISLP